MLGAHGGMHQKWHNAYEETVHVPFVVSSPLFKGGRREETSPPATRTSCRRCSVSPASIRTRRSSALPPTIPKRTLWWVATSRASFAAPMDRPSDPVLFFTDDEISEGSAKPGSPLQR